MYTVSWAGGLAVRSEPDTDADSVGSVAMGAEVEGLLERGEWLQIRFGDVVGWTVLRYEGELQYTVPVNAAPTAPTTAAAPTAAAAAAAPAASPCASPTAANATVPQPTVPPVIPQPVVDEQYIRVVRNAASILLEFSEQQSATKAALASEGVVAPLGQVRECSFEL
jgi:hypothetical protein